MARTNIVKKARKYQGKCVVCSKIIDVGDSYKWVQPRYRGRVIACLNCVIPQHMLSSSKMVSIYEEISCFAKDDIEGAADNLRDLIETIRGVADEYQESADNQREYFPDSEIAEENENKAEELNGWIDDIETSADEIEDYINQIDTLRDEQSNLEDDEQGEARSSEIDAEIENLESDIISSLDIIDNCPV